MVALTRMQSPKAHSRLTVQKSNDKEPKSAGFAGQTLQLQQQVGNRAVTQLLAGQVAPALGQPAPAQRLAPPAHGLAQPAIQRQPAPNKGPDNSFVQPSGKWYQVNDAFDRLVSALAHINQRDPTVTRAKWNEELESHWGQIGAPGEKSDTQLEALLIPLRTIERRIQDESRLARQTWGSLIAQYRAEKARLADDASVGPKATVFLQQRFDETVRRVVLAEEYLVIEDLTGLQSMLQNSTHTQWVRERLEREQEDLRQANERERRLKLKLYELSETELLGQVNGLRGRLFMLEPGSSEHSSVQEHLTMLEEELSTRTGKPYGSDTGAYPHEIALFSSYLIRGGYIQSLTNLLPAAWTKLPQAELTALLAQKYSEQELKTMFLAKYGERIDIKVRFRKLNIISALVTGLIWARENIKEGDWGLAASKVAGAGITAYAFNQLLYARDKSVVEIMAAKSKDYGRWFKGAARSNAVVDFLSRRLAPGLLAWSLKDIFMSGGTDRPNIPFDIIQTIDINDPSTWEPPNHTLLDLGFNLWYRQACTPEFPDACGPDLFLSKVEGSLTQGFMKFMDIAPHGVDDLKDRLYRIEGEYDITDLFLVRWVHRSVSASENVLVVATGQESGSKTGGMGHFRDHQVYPANLAALKLFGSPKPRWVNSNLLRQVQLKEEKK